MGIITTNAKQITGSISKNMGTLGRSLFNSSIGTLSSSETMNQLYHALDKLNSSIETIHKTVDIDALNGRNKAEDVFVLLAGLDIKSSSDFMNKNREFMKRLMRLNKKEKDITLDVLGLDAIGDSDLIYNENLRDYEHTKDNNYLTDYVSTLTHNQQVGDETTKLKLESSTNYNYAGLHNDLYQVTQNLYPDDENKGSFPNKWITENRNSLLYKTKKLFNSNKINTIISRFHTDPRKRTSLLDNATSKYGLSHGRNLLTKESEYGGNSSYVNGYDNPYCRVWTHHHQYDRYYKTIRPFSSVDSQGNYDGTISVADFHRWNQFSDDKDSNKQTMGKWGWKKESNNGWQYSVLQDNGRVNITPKYIDGGSSNIHTKQCMFSIENLAWRGYDPYSFEQALSWEQRGPLGGRIMWFPPYGIQFQETTTTQWQNNTFLGRGEDVYTYANTTRTGNLSFMMVVDHPSIIDYVTWTNKNKGVSDTDLLRFLAGCGEGDGNGGLRDLATPTPLTDEYTQVHEETYAIQNLSENTEQTLLVTPEEEKPIDDLLCFYVFYPNNYSGTYDDPEGDLGKKYGTQVEPIPYLLAGTGAQKSSPDMEDGKDMEISDKDVTGWNGNGYEMNNEGGLGFSDTNYITGTWLYPNSGGGNDVIEVVEEFQYNDKTYTRGCVIKDETYNRLSAENQNKCTKKASKNGRRYWTGLGKGNTRNEKYSNGTGGKNKNAKKWYYRIDGRYVYPQDSAKEEKSHYYNQTLKTEDSYKDTKSDRLNFDINKLFDARGELDKIEKYEDNTFKIGGNKDSAVYTLAEVAYVLYGLMENKAKQDKLNFDHPETNNRLLKLAETLNPNRIKEIKSITATGYASAHGYVETNQVLGQHRAETAAHWFVKNLNGMMDKSIVPTVGFIPGGIGEKSENDVSKDGWTTGDEGELNAKKWRFAKVEIAFTTAGETTPATANYEETSAEDDGIPLGNGFSFTTSHNAIPHNIINPSPIGKYDKSYEINRIEMGKKNNGNGYILYIHEPSDEEGEIIYQYDVDSYTEIGGEGGITVMESDEEVLYINKRRISFVVKDEENEKTENYVLFEYVNSSKAEHNCVICLCKNEIENYYYSEDDNFGEDFKFIFVNENPIVDIDEKDKELIEQSSDTNIKIKKIAYSSKEKILTIVDETEKILAENVVSSKTGDDGITTIITETGGIFCVTKNPIILTNGSKVIGITSSTNKLIGLNGLNYYYLTQMIKIDEETVEETGNDTILSIQKNNFELIKLAGNTLTMCFIEPDSENNAQIAVISDTYPPVNLEVKKYVRTEESSTQSVKYEIETKNNGLISITSYSDGKCRIYRKMESYHYIDQTITSISKVVDNYEEKPEELKKTLKKVIAKNENETKNEEKRIDEIIKSNENDKKKEIAKAYVNSLGAKSYVGYNQVGEGIYEGKKYPIYADSNKKKWYMVSDPKSKIAKFISVGYAKEYDVTPIERFSNGHGDENRLRYDQEYHFFKVLKQKDPLVFKSLVDKLQYFDPAFHSTTPEGFNGRLTFLQQCMRQGNTVSASDGKYAKSATNLAFGRAPYCVLRLGDFYNQMIVIDNLSINYDPLQWDLNVEGIGVQPLIAHVQLSFKFVGGGDLTGPVRRLQNAMSFNYYANTRLYDNRADRIERMWSDKTCGAIEHDEILDTSSKAFDGANAETDINRKKELLKEANIAQKKENTYSLNKKGEVRTSSFYTTNMYE